MYCKNFTTKYSIVRELCENISRENLITILSVIVVNTSGFQLFQRIMLEHQNQSNTRLKIRIKIISKKEVHTHKHALERVNVVAPKSSF
jgi:hypothetical protein